MYSEKGQLLEGEVKRTITPVGLIGDTDTKGAGESGPGMGGGVAGLGGGALGGTGGAGGDNGCVNPTLLRIHL